MRVSMIEGLNWWNFTLLGETKLMARVKDPIDTT
jgi:hypothetical protein